MTTTCSLRLACTVYCVLCTVTVYCGLCCGLWTVDCGLCCGLWTVDCGLHLECALCNVCTMLPVGRGGQLPVLLEDKLQIRRQRVTATDHNAKLLRPSQFRRVRGKEMRREGRGNKSDTIKKTQCRRGTVQGDSFLRAKINY
jgi:hypothetical protein